MITLGNVCCTSGGNSCCCSNGVSDDGLGAEWGALAGGLTEVLTGALTGVLKVDAAVFSAAFVAFSTDWALAGISPMFVADGCAWMAGAEGIFTSGATTAGVGDDGGVGVEVSGLGGGAIADASRSHGRHQPISRPIPTRAIANQILTAIRRARGDAGTACVLCKVGALVCWRC